MPTPGERTALPLGGVRRGGPWLVALFLAASLRAAPSDLPASELIAATINLPGLVAITHYDISLRTDLDHNRVCLETTCAVRNLGQQSLDRLFFKLLGDEQSYGAKVELGGVWAFRDGGRVACTFKHAPLERASDPKEAGTRQFPKLVRVELPAPLLPAAECRLRFDYAILVPEPAKETDSGYRLVAQLPNGDKEVCLMGDFAWIPRMSSGLAKTVSLGDRNFFGKGAKAPWQITLSHPASLESLVLDGRLIGSRQTNNTTISSYGSVIGAPQLLIGRCERIEVPGRSISVVYLLPKGKYQRADIEHSARFLQRAYDFYQDLFGPLEGKPIHVAVSSAGMGGHGAFLGMFLDKLPMRAADAFDETAAHELAHSWWGDAVSSYGRGTKFLRESLCNFAAWHLGRSAFHHDRFRSNALSLFCYGWVAKPLFLATEDDVDQAYNKGPFVVDQLRQEMGDETFFAVLRGFISRFRCGYASFADFVAVCNEVSGRDWLPFLAHWCYGQGIPAYHLLGFKSASTTNGWQTSVTITNAGRGIVTCPVELQTAAGPQRERFAVPESEVRVLVWRTPTRVTNVVVDPEHTALQGDAEEVRLRLMAAPDTMVSDNWLLYWKGAAHGDAGDYPRAEALLSQALGRIALARAMGLAKGPLPLALYSYYYSRGVVRLRMGQAAQGTEDLRTFLDGVLQPDMKNPASAEEVTKGLAYARMLTAQTPAARWEQLDRLLRQLTGAELPRHAPLAAWRQWWVAHRTRFELGPGARQLHPSGVGLPQAQRLSAQGSADE